MNKLKYVTLLTVFILGIASIQAQDEAKVAITLERTPCFGACPVYTVTIYDDGTVIYNGGNFVAVKGEQTSKIDPATVESTIASFEKIGYFGWDEAYDASTVSDMPGVISAVTRDGTTHRIVRSAGDSTAPRLLPFLEQWIDEMANTAIWTGVEPNSYIISDGTNTPVITLERSACFGFCPVYKVALFADGTGVYTGIANVDQIGVHLLQIDASIVDSIAQRANIFGYFDWQDSYEEQVMTDHATVITSIQWENQFKRIVRYTGDPNAPIGLMWIEDSIDQLVP